MLKHFIRLALLTSLAALALPASAALNVFACEPGGGHW